ncbi:hypothetical protein CFO_g236 [Ceratocystis platani]|uniref:Mitotic checkpoint regulator, MAD2B-interacting-domain-containing protein n=1 Tax=Ceratocystis fimbriata f. sp. platani TaxID=88771 RepID=A0A0F8B8R7_CERFI|nr:hypothetical protein CFO_g236 [Ceratocystis platani]
MGLVDYDSSGSDDDTPTPLPPPPKAPSTSKKPFQKFISSGKIRVSLPTASTPATEVSAEEPPAKRARIGTGAHKFSGFNSLLPAPKNRASLRGSGTTNNTPTTHLEGNSSKSTSGAKNTPRVGVNLKTGAGPAWSRDGNQDESSGTGGIMGPEIPEGMTPAEDVKLVGKPQMFMPLSVVRKRAKKISPPKKTDAVSATPQPMRPEPVQTQKNLTSTTPTTDAPAEPAKPISLFSFASTADEAPQSNPDEAYIPLFETAASCVPELSATVQNVQETDISAPQAPQNLADLADSMHLSAAARRELFGRGRDATDFASSKLVNFNMDQEYAHNEALRAKGEEQVHNPLRAIQPGKHSLRQLVSQVQNQREALEESFAAGKNKRREAGSRYGW